MNGWTHRTPSPSSSRWEARQPGQSPTALTGAVTASKMNPAPAGSFINRNAGASIARNSPFWQPNNDGVRGRNYIATQLVLTLLLRTSRARPTRSPRPTTPTSARTIRGYARSNKRRFHHTPAYYSFNTTVSGVVPDPPGSRSSTYSDGGVVATGSPTTKPRGAQRQLTAQRSPLYQPHIARRRLDGSGAFNLGELVAGNAQAFAQSNGGPGLGRRRINSIAGTPAPTRRRNPRLAVRRQRRQLSRQEGRPLRFADGLLIETAALRRDQRLQRGRYAGGTPRAAAPFFEHHARHSGRRRSTTTGGPRR